MTQLSSCRISIELCFSTMCSRNESELTEQPSFLISLRNNCSPENSRCLKSEDRLEGLPSRVMKHLSTSSHCVVGPLVTTQPEKCFPVVFTFPSVEVMLLSLEEIALNCLYVGVKKTSGKTVLGAYVIWTKGLNRGHQTLES